MEKTIDRSDDTINGSPSGDGSKMVIKLKIPKLISAAMEVEKPSSSKTAAKEGETTTISDGSGKRVCPECRKEFSSGKALGGHMRVHVLKPSKTSKFKKPSSSRHHDVINGDMSPIQEHQQKKQRKPDYLRCVNDEGKPSCYLCGKIFPSMKSLFGHMRCHPDRLWRGILPPPNTTGAAMLRHVYKSNFLTSSSLSENNDLSGDEEGSNVVDEVVDLTKFLRGWSVTERRGRPALKEGDADEVLQEAVEDLMTLANSDPSMAESIVTQRQLPADVFEGSNSNNLNKIDENSLPIDLRLTDYGDSNGKGKGKAVMEEEYETALVKIKDFSDDESDGRNMNELLLTNYKQKKNNPYKKRKKMKLMMELDYGGGTPPAPALMLSMASPRASAESKYKCTTCNKCFGTHQALGGHKSSHNKSKLTSTENHHQIEEDDYQSFLMNHSGQNEEFPGEITLTLNSSLHQHQCKICDQNFPTGQVLGGHKRCHGVGTSTGAAAQAPSSQVASTGEAASQTGSGRKGLDIDLNKVPPMMMEEDEDGNNNGNGYASSSSYNSNMG